jgi:hypothetical protein
MTKPKNELHAVEPEQIRDSPEPESELRAVDPEQAQDGPRPETEPLTAGNPDSPKPKPELRAVDLQQPQDSPAGADSPAFSEKETSTMASKKSELHAVVSTEPIPAEVTREMLDADEAEFARLRRDVPGVKGASAAGIVTIGVGKIPGKNEFFRTHRDFRPTIPMVDVEVGLEKQYFAVDTEVTVALAGIGISFTDHTLYLTITPRGGVKIVPVNATTDNEYARTKEIGLLDGVDHWVRLYTDQENKAYKVFDAPPDRFAEPIWPQLSHAKIFRLAFRDNGRLVDSPEHPLFKKWAARDRD